MQEDLFLRTLVEKQEKINWNSIKSILNEEFPRKQRSAKQCRERYINYSSFDFINGANLQWKPQELDTLYTEFDKYGAKWTKIAQSLPQKQINHSKRRSQNAIKNKFYGSLRKVIRKMNMIGKSSSKKIKKNIRYQSVARVIQAAQSFQTLTDQLKLQSLNLRQKIFILMRLPQLEYLQHQISELINRINKFNLTTRSYRFRKIRKNFKQTSSNAPSQQYQSTKPSEFDSPNIKLMYINSSFTESPHQSPQTTKNNQEQSFKDTIENQYQQFKDGIGTNLQLPELLPIHPNINHQVNWPIDDSPLEQRQFAFNMLP